MFLIGRRPLRDYLLSFRENRFSDLSTVTHLRLDTTRQDSRFLSSVRYRSLCYPIVFGCFRCQLTVTSRKAQAGTLVPFGIVFENLRRIVRASKINSNQDWRRTLMGGRRQSS